MQNKAIPAGEGDQSESQDLKNSVAKEKKSSAHRAGGRVLGYCGCVFGDGGWCLEMMGGCLEQLSGCVDQERVIGGALMSIFMAYLKTVVISILGRIAINSVHRLRTACSADEILVIDIKKTVETAKHDG